MTPSGPWANRSRGRCGFRVGYAALVLPLLVAGVGISLVFPPVANMVTASVPIEDAGVAAGANSAMRELGSVFGVAIIALVFAGTGSYSTPETFIDGFGPAMWVAAGMALLALVPALLAPGRTTIAVPGAGPGPDDRILPPSDPAVRR